MSVTAPRLDYRHFLERRSFIEMGARERVRAVLDAGSMRELLGPFDRIKSPWLPLQGIVAQADDGVVLAQANGVRAARVCASWLAGVIARAEGLADAPTVVGAAIVAGGAVLAAQRSYPPALAGRWEFPGGRVEQGETEEQAVVRECQEELGARVDVTGRVGPDLILPSGWVLRIHAARLVEGQRPDALEHHALRWVRAGEFTELDWLDADRAVLPALRELL